MAAVATREQAHELIERLALEKIPGAVELLKRIGDPVAYSLANAPLEDEEISAEEEEAVARAKANPQVASEESFAELLADFGLTTEEFWRISERPVASEIGHH